MKLQTKTNNIERVGVISENTFTIKSTAHSFEILSATLYTDNITAIIRELSCNAYDSHVAAGKMDVPFTVHLPNELEPYIFIRDYGIGLSDDDVLHLYTTYFESTKTDSNDYVGALGLGSKSPFSYTTSYEVISIFNGIRTSYHLFINENGVPDIAKMTADNTTECNGLEVRVGVEPKDFRTFISKTARTLKHFDVLPEIVGAISFNFDPKPTHTFSRHNWLVHEPNTTYYQTKITAIQGNIQYSVQLNQIEDELTQPEYALLRSINIVGFFNIGELAFAANREELRYTEQTKQTLVAFVKRVLTELVVVILDECVDQHKSHWDTCMFLSDKSMKVFGSRSTISNILREYVTNRPTTPPDQIQLTRFILNGGDVNIPHNLKHHSILVYMRKNIYNQSDRGYLKCRVQHDMEPNKSTQIMLCDIKTGYVGRLMQYATDNNIPINTKFILIKPIIQKQTDMSQLEDEYINITNKLGNPSIDAVSKFCPPIQRKPKPRTLKVHQFSSATYNRSYNQIANWTSEKADIATGGLYFVLKNKSQMYAQYDKSDETEIHVSPDNINTYLKNLVIFANIINPNANYTNDLMFGVPIQTFKKIKTDPNWIDVFDLIKQHLSKNHTYVTNIHRAVQTTSFGILKIIKQPKLLDIITLLPQRSKFLKLLNTAISHHGDQTQSLLFYEFCVRLCTVLNITINTDSEPYFTNQDFHAYPLLSQLETMPTSQTALYGVVEYIRLVDNNRNKNNIIQQ